MLNRASYYENIYCSEHGIENHTEVIESRSYDFRKNYSILLIDGDKTNRLKLQAVLEKVNFKVTTCGSSIKGLNLARNNFYDLIIADLEMGGRDNLGFVSTLGKLKPNFPNPEISLIVLASNNSDLEFEVIRRGADMFCDKKLAYRHLIKQINFLLDYPVY